MARVSDFFRKESKSNFFLFGGGGGGVDGWTGLNQFAPSTSSKLGV